MIVLSQDRRERALWSPIYYQGWYKDKSMIQQLISLKYLPNLPVDHIYHKMEIIANMLEQVYPGLWDITIMSEVAYISFGSAVYTQQYNGNNKLTTHDIMVIIRFPEINLTGGRVKESYKIYDLLLYISMNFHEDRITINQKMYATRLTSSIAEVDCHYHFSHSNTRDYLTYLLGGCCIGTSETYMMITIFNNNEQENDNVTGNLFKMFLINLQTYVSYESVDGGPYIYSDKVYRTSQRTDNLVMITNQVQMSDFTINILVNTIVQKLAEEHYLKISFVQNTIHISHFNTEAMVAKISEIIMNNFNMNEIKSVMCISRNGNFYKIPNNYSSRINTATYDAVSKMVYGFQGNLIHRRIYDYHTLNSNTPNYDIKINPNLIKQLTPYVNSFLNKAFIKHTYSKRLSASRG